MAVIVISSKVLSRYGDRIAVQNVCHRQLQTPDRKNALLQRLRSKLEAHSEGARKDEEKTITNTTCRQPLCREERKTN